MSRTSASALPPPDGHMGTSRSHLPTDLTGMQGINIVVLSGARVIVTNAQDREVTPRASEGQGDDRRRLWTRACKLGVFTVGVATVAAAVVAVWSFVR